MATIRQLKARQPQGLYLLFLTELWERFGFYTLQTILILYMTKSLLMSDVKANTLYAAFSSLLFLTPSLGGYLADRYLGFQRAIILGGILFIAGYILCGLPSQHAFFIGLSLQICGNGFFKPNVSSLVGELYHYDDPRRDGGFTLFYMGINIGALIPPIIAGELVTLYGWHSGFLLAAGGMALGQIFFMFGRRKILGAAGLEPHEKHASKAHASIGSASRFYTFIFLGLLALIGLLNLAFRFPQETNYIVEIVGVMILITTLFFLFKEPMRERKRLLACLILIIISLGFWALYNQTFTSLMLFADRNMTKNILGLPIDAEATQFFNPFFIITLSPLLSYLWVKLDDYHLNPPVQIKFSLGLLAMGAGFLVLALAATYFGKAGMTSPWWLVLSYGLQTTGELLISPVGLSMITVLCPRHLIGMMMGVWFFSVAVGFTLGAPLANIAAVADKATPLSSIGVYAHAFTVYGVIALGFAVVSFALVPVLNRLIISD
jgi:POT family proton-dependent oligopeptide transporter